jgi:hypothetical protein
VPSAEQQQQQQQQLARQEPATQDSTWLPFRITSTFTATLQLLQQPLVLLELLLLLLLLLLSA